MKDNTPRLMFAAAGSGSGKTTVTCAVLQALVNSGLHPASFKCGPDYIDSMFHSEVIGTPARNLDLFFYGEATACALLEAGARGCELSILEGVMGYYDGVGGATTRASSYHLASATKTPVVLVVNAHGMALSLAALIKGFVGFVPESGIAAVLLNNCSAGAYPMLKAVVEENTGLPVVGYLPHLAACTLESRHLGLVTAAEVEHLREKLQLLAEQASKTIDLAFLVELAQSAPKLVYQPPRLPKPLGGKPLRIAIARDKAFCFYYEDSLQLLRTLGAELIPFSPLEDDALPENICGVLLGGGYPELYAKELSQNATLLWELHRRLAAGLPCIAECGGFLYLHKTLESAEGATYPMVGAVEAHGFNTHKLCRFGYATLTAQHETLLCAAGESIPVHEFHHWDSTANGDACVAQKPTGTRSWSCIHAQGNLWAGFAHLHFYANPHFAWSFLNRCSQYKVY